MSKGFRTTAGSDLPENWRHLLNRGQLPRGFGDWLDRRSLNEDQRAGIPTTVSATNPVGGDVGVLDDLLNSIYVDLNAPAGGDGSQVRPFNDPQDAADQVFTNGDASASNPYTLMLSADKYDFGADYLFIRTPHTRVKGAGIGKTVLTATGKIVYVGNATKASADAVDASEANLNTSYSTLVADPAHDAMDGVLFEDLSIEQQNGSVYAVVAVNIGDGLAADLVNGGMTFRNCRVFGSMYLRNQGVARMERCTVRYEMEWRNIRSIYTEHATLSKVTGSYVGSEHKPSGVALSYWSGFETYFYDDVLLDDIAFKLSSCTFDDALHINGPALLAEIIAGNMGSLTLESDITITVNGALIKGDLETVNPGTIAATLKDVRVLGNANIAVGANQSIGLQGSKIHGAVTDPDNAISFAPETSLYGPEPVGANCVGAFDGSLIDASGNGRDLVLSAGTARTGRAIYRERDALYYDGLTHHVLDEAGDNAAFLLAGAMTLEFVCMLLADVTQTLISFAGPSDAEADNIQWQLGYIGTGVAEAGQLVMWWEHGPGTDIPTYSEVAIPLHQKLHIAVSRDANGQVQFYANGHPLGPRSGSQTMPTGGSTAVLKLASNSNNSSRANRSYIASARVYSVERSAADILAAAKAALPSV